MEKKSQLWKNQCLAMNEPGSDLDTCQASKILHPNFNGASGFSFHCRKIMPKSKTRDYLILGLT